MTPSWLVILAECFDPFIFVMVMGIGISSNLLYSFPYQAEWLKRCSYPMFAVACLIFLYAQLLQFVHMYVYVYSKKRSYKEYFNDYFRNLTRNVFWGTYPMGFATIINYIASLATYQVRDPAVARRLMRLTYIFWWYDVLISLICAWGISFLIWQKHYYPDSNDSRISLNEKMARENLGTTLLLLVIPLVVAASSSSIFTMTELFSTTFNRNIQLMTMVVTSLMWLHAIIFVFILIFINFWNLYVNKIPAMLQVFTLFLFLGPMGQASYGILLITENVKLYTQKYYPITNFHTEPGVLSLVVPWCFKIFGLLAALALLSMGYFFTIFALLTISTYYNTRVQITSGQKSLTKRIYHFHKGWFSMTFPMGTMSLGSSHIYVYFDKYVPLSAFRVIGAIYAAVCIIWCLICLIGTIWVSVLPTIVQIYRMYRYDKSEQLTDHSENTTVTEAKSNVP